MKIRNGFVSNSSSSSFMIFGICFDSSTDVFKEAKIEHDEDNDDTDVMTILENEITKRGLNLEVQYAGDSDYVILVVAGMKLEIMKQVFSLRNQLRQTLKNYSQRLISRNKLGHIQKHITIKQNNKC